jgi:hypothetical protein
LRAKQLFDAAEKGDIHLLNEMKKLVNKKSSDSLPECIEGVDNPDDIVEKFKVQSSKFTQTCTTQPHLPSMNSWTVW